MPRAVRPSRTPTARPSAKTRVCRTSALATSRLPAPRALAIADETPPPMPLAAVCWMSMMKGKASETPASASAPSRPMKRPSKVIMPAMARRLSTFGAESRSNVGSTGAFQQKLGASCDGGLGGVGCGRRWRKRDGLGAHGRSSRMRVKQHLGTEIPERRAAALGTRLRVNARRGVRNSPSRCLPAKHRFLG